MFLRSVLQVKSNYKLMICMLQAREKVKGQDVLKPTHVRRGVWESTMKAQYPLLTRIATRVLSLHATSCSANRN